MHLAAGVTQPGDHVGRRPVFLVRQLGARIQVTEILLPGPDRVRAERTAAASSAVINFS